MLLLKKKDYATEISNIKNDYVTNASLSSQLADLKNQHIKDGVKKVDDKVTKNTSDILGFENRLKQKEDLTDDLQRESSFFRGDYYYNQQSYVLYEPISGSYDRRHSDINFWKSTGIHNDGTNTHLTSVNNSTSVLPKLLN